MADGQLSPAQIAKLQALISRYANACTARGQCDADKYRFAYDDLVKTAINYLDAGKDLDAYLREITRNEQ